MSFWTKIKDKIKRSKGFTIVELMVAMGIFTVITTIGVGSFTTALRAQRQASLLLAANSNMSLVMEQMMRELRTGKDFCYGESGLSEWLCALNFSNFGPKPFDRVITFKNSADRVVTYCIQSGTNFGRILRNEGSSNCGGQILTSENVWVRYFRIQRIGVDNPFSSNNLQPRVTISIGISPKGDSAIDTNIIGLQTTVSSRLPLDI